ncbi:hypothetical protein [Clostridium sp. 001]|uniref:hypothetical protein n=1 Tax=Clostridium sp. 001 TaxID=1970093 RepID=UPI001C2C97BC|nr:hypothetical protein [Clostridium sp. 001]QXE19502.1 hypothetical protein B5S50_12105 [Clostridium sp. 001]
MTKEEIALQLTLARLNELQPTRSSNTLNHDDNIAYNEEIANETVKMFNTIYNKLDKFND